MNYPTEGSPGSRIPTATPSPSRKGSRDEGHVSRGVSGVQGGAGPPAQSRDRAATGDGGGRRGEAEAAARRPRPPADERPGPESGLTAQLPLAEGPCPSCVALIDQLDGAARHAALGVSLTVVAKAPLDRILTFAGERDWRWLRFLS